MKSKNFEKYKGYYDSGIWNAKMLDAICEKGKITKEELEEILGTGENE